MPFFIKVVEKSPAKKVKETYLSERSSDGFEHNAARISSLFGFNFPWWCNTGRRKKSSSKASGSFCHVSLQTLCLHAHIRPWERQTQRQIHTAHTHTEMYRHTRARTHARTHTHTEQETILPGSLGLSCCLILIHLQN